MCVGAFCAVDDAVLSDGVGQGLHFKNLNFYLSFLFIVYQC